MSSKVKQFLDLEMFQTYLESLALWERKLVRGSGYTVSSFGSGAYKVGR